MRRPLPSKPPPGPPGRGEIALAVPHGSRRARSQVEFLRAVQAELADAQLRGDRAQNVLWWAEIHARHASWEDRTTRPTRELTCRLAAFCISTYKSCRRWLAEHGLIGLVRPGRVPDLRPMALVEPGERNDAAIYVLCVPRRKPPPGPAFPRDPVTRPLTGLRRSTVQPCAREAPFLARLVRQATGQTITDGWAAHLERPFRKAGYTDADLRHAVDWPRDGAQHPYLTRGVRHPVRWLLWRLAQHLPDCDRALLRAGKLRWREVNPLPSRSQAASIERGELIARQDLERQARAAAAALRSAQGFDPSALIDEKFAELGWTRPGQNPRRLR